MSVMTPVPIERPRLKAADLSPRELEILGLMAFALSNKEIADRLHLTEKTVKNHISRLFDKMGAINRMACVLQGLQDGLIQLNAIKLPQNGYNRSRAYGGPLRGFYYECDDYGE